MLFRLIRGLSTCFITPPPPPQAHIQNNCTRYHVYHHLKRYTQLARMSSNTARSTSPHDQDDICASLKALIDEGYSPKVLLKHVAPNLRVPEDATDAEVWRILVSAIQPPKREKLDQYNTIEDAVELIKKSKKIVVLSGAGISTSAGLPDFRSRSGIYVQIHKEHPDLSDPKSMFDIEYFRKNPAPFYQFAKALFPGQFKPTIGHKFIKCIEDHKKLLRNYTQNIDTLEKQAEITRVVECHGSFAKATCTNCKYSVDGEEIREDVFAQRIPKCPQCYIDPEYGMSVLKPNIVFFGEQLGGDFHSALEADKDQVDLLIVIGSSLKVRPVALLPRHISPKVPQILINKERLEHVMFDIELLGDCDHIIQELCLRLGGDWTKLCEPVTKPLKQLDGQAEMHKIREKLSNDSKRPDQPVGGDKDNSDNSKTDVSDEEDWEDVSTDEEDFDEKVKMPIPETSFLFIEPNIYLFKDSELTKAQIYMDA